MSEKNIANRVALLEAENGRQRERIEELEAERDQARELLRELYRTAPDTSCFSDEGLDALDAAKAALND